MLANGVSARQYAQRILDAVWMQMECNSIGNTGENYFLSATLLKCLFAILYSDLFTQEFGLSYWVMIPN